MRLCPLHFASCLLLCLAAYAKQPIVQTDLLKMQKVTEVQVAPDGSFAIYGVQSTHSEGLATSSADPIYSYRVNLWMSDLRDPGSKPVQLTFGDRSDAMLVLSPDGHELAFVRTDNSKKDKPKPQVWILPLGTPGEAHMVTTLEYGASNPHWRADGKALLVASPIPVSKLPGKPTFDLERPGRGWFDAYRAPDKPAKAGTSAKDDAELPRPDGDLHSIRAWLDRDAEHSDPVDITRIAFLGEMSLNGEMTFGQLFRVNLEGEPRATQLTNTYYDHEQAVYSPSGDRILFTSRPSSNLHPDRVEAETIWQMNADGTQEHPLLNDSEYSFSRAQFTPDGKHIALIGVQNDQPTYRQSRLALCDANGNHLKWLTPDGDPSVQQPQISPDGHIYYTVAYHGGEPLRRVSYPKAEVQEVVAAGVGVNAFSVAPGKLVYAQISVENPNELYLKASAQGQTRRLTEFNARWLEGKTLSLPEEHWITRPDGIKVQYWVMKPTNAEPGKKYPWVLDMHGGPSAMWGPGEYSMWHEFQEFCAFGYGVVYANPRGSSGYGYQFQHANYKDWGDGPMGDVMASLDDAQAKNPSIDNDRLFITGGSYAGYLTAWIIGHSKRFKAAAALRGVYDLSTFFGEGNAFRLVPDEFGGFPWTPDVRKLLDRESPITYVAEITTPLLIIHGSADNRTGVVQGQMLFRSLKELNRPVEYARYPNIGHELTRSGPPQQRMDHMLRIIEFFERYAANDRPAPQEVKSTIQ